MRTYLWQTEKLHFTKNGPLKTRIRGLTSIKKAKLLTHLKFENRSRMLHPKIL